MIMVYLVFEKDYEHGNTLLEAFSTKELAQEFINDFKYPDTFLIEDYVVDNILFKEFPYPKKDEDEYEVYMTMGGKVLEVRSVIYSIYLGSRIANFDPDHHNVLFNHCYAKNEEDAVAKTNQDRLDRLAKDKGTTI